jgi:cytoskeletal protein CcmA (bactofilin family)
MFRRRGRHPERNELTAFIDEGSEMEGRYTFRGTVMLNGRIKGEISSADTLIIGERGVLEADISAGRVRISGEVTGNVRAAERIELKPTARVYGDVEAPVVVLEEGAVFEGHCRIARPAPAAEGASARDLTVVPLKR